MLQREKPLIYWDESIKAYRLRVPYDLQLIGLIKSFPYRTRNWDGREWKLDESIIDIVKSLCLRLFPDTKFYSREEFEQSKLHAQEEVSNGESKDISRRFQEITNIVPTDYGSAHKAYQKTMLKLHPDKGGDTIAAMELNEVWREMEKRFKNGLK